MLQLTFTVRNSIRPHLKSDTDILNNQNTHAVRGPDTGNPTQDEKSAFSFPFVLFSISIIDF